MCELLQVNSNSIVASLFAGLVVIGLLFGFILYFIFSYRHKQKDFQLLQSRKEQIDTQNILLENTLEELKATQSRLIHREKMASLGELTAGIAHEIQNPLNFITNFSDLNAELTNELQNELQKNNTTAAVALALQIKENENKINLHGKRADSIVKGMLQHSRSNTGQKELTDINALAADYLKLSYHGIRTKDKTFNCNFSTDLDKNLQKLNVVPQEIGSVLLNLFNNAFYAVTEKMRNAPENYEPAVSVKTNQLFAGIEIRIRDNGNGILKENQEKIFHPFFTTKPSGRGTGLGLSLTYGIIKGHGGTIAVFSEPGSYTEFTIQLPI